MPADSTSVGVFSSGSRLAAGGVGGWQRAGLLALARHFRTLHRSCGVAAGLIVTTLPPEGAGSEWRLAVERGVAYDAYGRPLTLHDCVTITLPGDGDLVVLRGEPPAWDHCGRPVPAPPRCVEVRLIRAGERLAWDVVLGAPRRNDNGNWDVDGSARMNAGRGFRRPFVASGEVPAGTTAATTVEPDWKVWIDTRAAGFLQVPVYLVAVGGPTLDDFARLVSGQANLNGDPAAVLGNDGLGNVPCAVVSGARKEGFLLSVHYPAGGKGQPVQTRSATPLDVFWMGVEQPVAGPQGPDGGCVTGQGVVVSSKTTPQPEYFWPAFAEGGRLTAESLNEVQTTLRELQWLHNRTLHDWGVVEGCAVTALKSRRGVRVEPGFALDVSGRELFLRDAYELAIPPGVPGPGVDARRNYWVTIRYRDAVDLPAQDPSCRAADTPLRRLPGAIVRWRDPRAVPPDQLDLGTDVILATVWVEQGEVVDITSSGRRDAPPPGRPHLAAGRTAPSAQWEPWPCPDSPLGVEGIKGIKMKIDTTQAGFQSTPAYLVQLEADKPENLGNELRVEAVHVVHPTSQGFEVICLLRDYQEQTTTEEVCTFFTHTKTTTTTWGAAGLPPWDAIQRWLDDGEVGIQLGVAWLGIEN